MQNFNFENKIHKKTEIFSQYNQTSCKETINGKFKKVIIKSFQQSSTNLKIYINKICILYIILNHKDYTF